MSSGQNVDHRENIHYKSLQIIRSLEHLNISSLSVRVGNLHLRARDFLGVFHLHLHLHLQVIIRSPDDEKYWPDQISGILQLPSLCHLDISDPPAGDQVAYEKLFYIFVNIFRTSRYHTFVCLLWEINQISHSVSQWFPNYSCYDKIASKPVLYIGLDLWMSNGFSLHHFRDNDHHFMIIFPRSSSGSIFRKRSSCLWTTNASSPASKVSAAPVLPPCRCPSFQKSQCQSKYGICQVLCLDKV